MDPQISMSSVAGIVALTMAIVAVIKGRLALVPALQKLPLWLYVIAITEALTAVAHYALGSLPGEPRALFWQAFLMAGAASGIREWFQTLFKPVEQIKGQDVAQSPLNRSLMSVLLIVGLGGGALLLSSGCAHHTPRHDTVVSLRVVTSALGAVQDTERTLYQAGRIAPGEYDVTTGTCKVNGHRCFSAKLAKALELTDDAALVVQAWRPGEPVPKQLAAAVGAIRPALEDALALVSSAEMGAKVLQVYDALAAMLALMGGAL